MPSEVATVTEESTPTPAELPSDEALEVELQRSRLGYDPAQWAGDVTVGAGSAPGPVAVGGALGAGANDSGRDPLDAQAARQIAANATSILELVRVVEEIGVQVKGLARSTTRGQEDEELRRLCSETNERALRALRATEGLEAQMHTLQAMVEGDIAGSQADPIDQMEALFKQVVGEAAVTYEAHQLWGRLRGDLLAIRQLERRVGTHRLHQHREGADYPDENE